MEHLVQNGYPEIAGMEAAEFMRRIEPRKKRIGELARLEKEAKEGRIPFVIVIKNELVAAEKAMRLVEVEGKRGFTNMDADDIKRFKPIDGVRIPNGMAYLAVDIDTGKGTFNVTADGAIKAIRKENRSPLTVDEGVALVTHHPEILRINNCFSMVGSRRGDRRVTALWISGDKPRLGWCWSGNSHSWLGSASCRSRVGLTSRDG